MERGDWRILFLQRARLSKAEQTPILARTTTIGASKELYSQGAAPAVRWNRAKEPTTGRYQPELQENTYPKEYRTCNRAIRRNRSLKTGNESKSLRRS